jgi:hypothetical protein
MVIFAPGGPWLVPPASTGLMESWEMPATFETRLVTWLLTCEATSDSACLVCRQRGTICVGFGGAHQMPAG